MKILATSDIHQFITKWKDLVKVCNEQKPDILAIAGDLCPKDGIPEQLSFIKHLVKYAKQINNNGTQILILLGNDDNQLLAPEMEKYDKEGIWHYIPEKVVEINGYEFAGMPYVPDYPFGYKYWCRGEFRNELRISQSQYSDPLLINSDNKFEVIPNYKEYLLKNKTIHEVLEEMAPKIKNFDKSIWLIHAPPSDLFLDVCAHGAKVGSKAILDFIKRYQPFITIHGHIHESPEYNGHKWSQNCDKTLCIQGGQIDRILYYSIIELEDGKITRLEHSIYGKIYAK